MIRSLTLSLFITVLLLLCSCGPKDPHSLISTGSFEDLAINVGDRVYFDFNKSEIKDEAKPTLNALIKWMQIYQDKLVILIGYADERGPRLYNYKLGLRRANSTKDYLVRCDSSLNSRLEIRSGGEDFPDVLGESETAWAKNRVVKFKVD